MLSTDHTIALRILRAEQSALGDKINIWRLGVAERRADLNDALSQEEDAKSEWSMLTQTIKDLENGYVPRDDRP